jgi:hypothetical protein
LTECMCFVGGSLGVVLVNSTYKCFTLFHCNTKFYKFDADCIIIYRVRNPSKRFKSKVSQLRFFLLNSLETVRRKVSV